MCTLSWFNLPSPVLPSPVGTSEQESKAKYSYLSAPRGAILSSAGAGGINGAARREDPVYAGFELELAGVERYRKRETPDGTELAATNVLM